MSILVVDAESILAQSVSLTDDFLIVELTDGRSLSVPLAWYPRLQHGTPEERNRWRLIGCGDGIHWPELDEDISISGLVAGRPSGESSVSLERWLKARAKG
jgi:hypothetical protein